MSYLRCYACKAEDRASLKTVSVIKQENPMYEGC